MPRRRAALLASALGALLVVAGAAPAEAASTGSVGADVSYHQCGRPWAGAQAFAVVAVNTGVPTGTNPCLAEQLTLASLSPGTGHPALSVYVNTANPKPSEASWWPTSDRTRRGVAVKTPYGHCAGKATAACSYVYGTSLALDDLQVRGMEGVKAARWWLDVETANSWSSSTKRNRAVLEGMTRLFTSAGQKVGLYALSHEFRDLIGTVPKSSPLSSLPSWLAGAADQAHASTMCSRAPLTRGRVLLVQWLERSGTDRFDKDLACTALGRSSKPKVVGARSAGSTLTASAGTWASGATLTYSWTRDGAPISGATKATYRLVERDAGHRIAVVVTGTRDGASRTERTSAATAVRV